MNPRTILVTNALPYANGPIHLGHLLGYIQADIWVRAMRAIGHQVIYVCADDAHGTAIMLRAEENGISPEQQIAHIQQQHERDFAGFEISFDHYDSTHAPTNQYRANEIYLANRDAGHIAVREVKQLFDPEKQMFLSDRFIKGNCPKCDAADQYGDSCEVCGATYNATELKQPRSTLSGATPVEKTSDHYFFTLPNFKTFLQRWTRDPGRLPTSIANKLDEWFDMGLNDWDISRDAPYFGFEIPDAPNKYFYVWVDAPIGYMSSFENYIHLKRPELKFEDFWSPKSQHEVYHFIGKDIVYFHALFWPAMLEGAGYRTPTALFVNGFLTVNGLKMSKSRGTFIKAETYLKHLNPEYLRYYFASKLSDKVEDSDLNLDDFIQKVNADLVGKVVNIASRCAKFINTQFDNQLADTCVETILVQQAINAGTQIIHAYETREFGRAVRHIMTLADQANQYIDEQKPWALAKQPGNETAIQQICTVGLNLFRILTIYLSPILPHLAQQVASLFRENSYQFKDAQTILLNHTINSFVPLMQRVDKAKVAEMIEDSKEDLSSSNQQHKKISRTTATPLAQSTQSTGHEQVDDQNNMINIEDFTKIQLKVAKVIQAEIITESDKLLKLTLDIGDEHPRQVLSGIAKQYQPEELIDKLVVLVSNLKPRKMRFGLSEGMVLAASNQRGIFMLTPDTGAQPGDIIS